MCPIRLPESTGRVVHRVQAPLEASRERQLTGVVVCVTELVLGVVAWASARVVHRVQAHTKASHSRKLTRVVLRPQP